MRGGILWGPAPLSHPNTPHHRHFREKTRPAHQKTLIWAILSAQGELLRARTHTRPSRANFCAHRTQPRANFETNNTSAATDAGQHETAGTTALPQTATIETGNTTATEKCTKNAHFAPAKATTVSVEARPAPAKATGVSVEARPAPAKATGVSDNRPSWPTGPGGGAHGRRRGLAGRPVGGRRYKRRQTNAIQIASRGPLLQTSSI